MHKFKYIGEQGLTGRWYRCDEPNKKGETIVVVVSKCELVYDRPHAFGTLWKARGWIDGSFDEYWHVSCTVYDEKGNGRGGYNPSVCTNTGSNNQIVNFDFINEFHDKGVDDVLDEIWGMFVNCEPTRHASVRPRPQWTGGALSERGTKRERDLFERECAAYRIAQGMGDPVTNVNFTDAMQVYLSYRRMALKWGRWTERCLNDSEYAKSLECIETGNRLNTSYRRVNEELGRFNMHLTVNGIYPSIEDERNSFVMCVQ